MKFTTNSIKSTTARCGVLTEFKRIPNSSFETPLVLIYTKHGSVPHLTKDVFQMVTSTPQLLSISLPSTISMFESVKNNNMHFAEFIGMKEYINFLTIQDPGCSTPSGFHLNNSIPIWTRNGKVNLTANEYMDIIEAFKPDLYVALSDGDTNSDSGVKRVTNAVNRTSQFFQQCFIKHCASEALKSSEMLGTIEGGYDISARTMSINYLKDKPLIGYVIDGLHNNGPDVKDISSEQIKEVVKHTVDLLPADKLKVSMGCWNPLTVLDLVQLGIDIFDTTYPYIITENLEALTFLCNHDGCNNSEHVISLTEKRFVEDLSPICAYCECLACKNHTKAYLYHLCNTREMLATVLLMIHNVHHYLKFFENIREEIKSNTFDEYKERIESKFKRTNNIPRNEFATVQDNVSSNM